MLILPFLFLFHFSNAKFAEVSTPYGRVQGSLRNTSKMTPFYSFQGLPFAAPPVGNLRLLPPQPPISWDTPLDLTGILSINFQISYLVTKFYLLVIYLCMNIYFFLNLGDSDILCPQLTNTVSGDLIGQEDCLYLNIYTPADLNQGETSSLPVVVWIYGGGFITGSARITDYGPEKWLDQGILVVAMNYR